MKIAIINFSGRKEGNCAKICKALQEEFEKEQVRLLDFCDLQISSCKDCDYECFADGKICPQFDRVKALYDAILQADVAFYVLPNYCDYPCANFFIFNESGCAYFSNNQSLVDAYLAVKKKFIVVSNMSRDNFAKAFSYHIPASTEADVLYLSAKKFDKDSIKGDILDNVNAQRLLNDFANGKEKIEESAMAIVISANYILYTVEDIYGKLRTSLPKGHIESGETHIDTAIRECFEETGVQLSANEFVGEGTPYAYVFVDHNYNIIRKKIYPVLFRQERRGRIKRKEQQIKQIGYKPIVDFFIACDYDNVRQMLVDILKKYPATKRRPRKLDDVDA